MGPHLSWEIDTANFESSWRGVLKVLATKLALLTLIILPVVGNLGILSSITFESKWLGYLLIAELILLGLWLTASLLVGKQLLIDPPLFVSVLIFALLTTVSYLLSPGDPLKPTDARNTFGVPDVKFLSALAIIAFIGSYYLTTAWLYTADRVRLVWKTAIFGIIAFVLLGTSWINWAPTKLLSNQIWQYNQLVLLSIPLLANISLFRRNRTQLTAISLLTLLVAGVVGYQVADIFWTKLTVALVLIAQIVWVWRTTAVSIGELLSNFRLNLQKLVSRKLEFADFVYKNNTLLLILFALIWLIALVVWTLVNKFDIATELSNLVRGYTIIFTQATGVQAVIVGSGISSTIAGSSLMNILRAQGLVGLVAYIVLGISSLMFVLKRARQELTSKKTGQALSLSTIAFLVAVPLLSLLQNLTLYAVWWWWFLLSLQTADVAWLKVKAKELRLWSVSHIHSPNLKRVVIVGQILSVIVVWVVVVTLINAISGLVATGTI